MLIATCYTKVKWGLLHVLKGVSVLQSSVAALLPESVLSLVLAAKPSLWPGCKLFTRNPTPYPAHLRRFPSVTRSTALCYSLSPERKPVPQQMLRAAPGTMSRLGVIHRTARVSSRCWPGPCGDHTSHDTDPPPCVIAGVSSHPVFFFLDFPLCSFQCPEKVRQREKGARLPAPNQTQHGTSRNTY